MTDLRKSTSYAEVMADNDPSLRASTSYAEVMADMAPSFRVSTGYAEVMVDNDPLFRSSQAYAEVMVDNDPTIRVTQYQLEVILQVREAKHPVFPRRPSWMERSPRVYDEPFLPPPSRAALEREPTDVPVEPVVVGVEHWWLDMELGGFWKLQLASDDFDPQSILAFSPLSDQEKSDVVLGGADGYARHLDRTLFRDDGVSFESKVMFGPFLIGPSSWTEGLVEAIQGVLTPDSGSVTWEVRVHREWEDAASEDVDAVATGTWDVPDVNDWRRPRRRGTVFSVLLVNAEPNDGWSIEEIVMHTSERGKRRYGG